MITRKSVHSLSQSEIDALVHALIELKGRGEYDKYVHWHHQVMYPTVLPQEPRDANYRNGAHRGPSFLPWHRDFLMQLEQDLRTIDASVSLPYWDWTQDAKLPDPSTSPLWADTFMGGNGEEGDQWRVQRGPFAESSGKWPVPSLPDDGLPGTGLKRQFGRMLPSLPTEEDLALAMAEVFYDTPNYERSPFTIGFRNRIEGWVTQRGDARVKTPGSQLHNRVHLWIGGNMAPMTSPNDPVFFLHHCFIDKVWADWQAVQMAENPDAAPHYAPERSGPTGHNLDDQLKPSTRTVRDVLSISGLGYEYEPAHNQVMLETFARSAIRRRIRTPFWAD
ncbi:tyrosinase family protein [Albitalea terrae]|uniref:Tyrosinase family protein n=2 Tax=Piscinibacter terrae TaxID=2496871 RepID=A0A3N7HII6_9BURK|nr:tyrosinase family protein [Albitalea terrae]